MLIVVVLWKLDHSLYHCLISTAKKLKKTSWGWAAPSQAQLRLTWQWLDLYFWVQWFDYYAGFHELYMTPICVGNIDVIKFISLKLIRYSESGVANYVRLIRIGLFGYHNQVGLVNVHFKFQLSSWSRKHFSGRVRSGEVRRLVQL